MAKGIRVSELAHELNVPAKAIVEKAKSEGMKLNGKDFTASSSMGVGMAETFREWHAAGELASFIAAANASGGSKKKTPAKKKAAGTDEGGVATLEADAEGHPHLVQEGHAEETDTAPVAEPMFKTPDIAPPEPAAEPETPAAPAHATTAAPSPELTNEVHPTPAVAPEAPATAATPAPAPVAQASAATPAAPLPAPVEAPTAPVAAAPAAPAVARPAAGPTGPVPPVARPTVRLEKSGPTRPERPRVVATPFVPKPAELQGPKVVREEKPDMVAAPRRRPLPGQGGPMQPNALGPSTPRGGRGVRVAEGGEDEAKKPAAARRRGPDGRRGEADEKLRDFSEQDLKDRADRINAASAIRQSVDAHLRKTEARGTHVQARTAAQRGGVLEVEEPITVRSLSTDLGVKSNELISKLMRKGVFANVNQGLDFDTAALLSLDYNVELRIKRQPTLEELLMDEFDARREASTNLQPRPPVVTILGHVDHGKTSLLDKIRSASVASGEAGGITQHIAAWQVTLPGDKKVTFIDTPGHQAFTAMRARGANMTDVVVLVIDAAQGIQPQTSESINHAKAAGVPIVVALNKIDRPDANPDMVLGQLAGAELNPVEWGGDTEVVRTSAFTGQGIPELLEILEYQSDLRELRADPDSPARGSVIESRMDPGLGPVATVLVQDGTLKVGDVVLSGQGWGKVRSLLNDQMKPIREAGPSTPVVISGLSELPAAGDKFFAMDDLDRARSIAAERLNAQRAEQLANKSQVSLDSIYGQMKESQIKTINLIVKADVQGSIETLQKTITDQNTEEVRVKVIHAAVGAINESDVELADASKAVIIGFHVIPDEAARAMAEQRRIEIRTYRVIYEIFDDLKKALSGMLEPEIREKLHGHAEVRKVFSVSRLGNIAGCMVTDGHIQRGSKIRLTRDGTIITEDLAIESLKRGKDDAKEVKNGFECGIKLAGYDDVKPGDILEAYIRETIQRTL